MILNELIWHARDVAGAAPRVHGNGFIQLNLSETVRLHVWGHPDIPRQKTDTPIHDHRFGFHSVVLRGMMCNVSYHVYWDEHSWTHFPYEAKTRQGEDTVLVPCNTTHGSRLVSKKSLYTPGQSYAMNPGDVHESIPNGLTVTLVSKHGIDGVRTPRVYVPVGTKPDNTFNRYDFPENDLWKIITKALQ